MIIKYLILIEHSIDMCVREKEGVERETRHHGSGTLSGAERSISIKLSSRLGLKLQSLFGFGES